MNGGTMSQSSCNACWRSSVLSKLDNNCFLSFSDEEHFVSENVVLLYSDIAQLQFKFYNSKNNIVKFQNI